MSEHLPSDAAIKEALRRTGGYTGVTSYEEKYHLMSHRRLILAARLIQQHEPETLVDPYLKRARELLAEEYDKRGARETARLTREGGYDDSADTKAVIRALKEGMGK